jgi:Zn-dependent peptidase ImmA (M78 family)/DNA-binding XRE family transcriptional regulator
MTQVAAAAQLGVSQAALNQYEAGKRRVDALTLERLGRLYGVPLSAFFGDEPARPDWEEALRLRARELSPAGWAGVMRLIEALHDLELLHARTGTDLPGQPYPPFAALPDSPMPRDDIARWAEKVRRHFDLGVAPLPDIRGFLEAQGYKVFAVSLGSGEEDLSGLYFRHPALGPVVALNADKAYTRRAFTMAHELAHALFHHDRPAVLCRSHDQRPIEQFADCFASYFLVPPEALHDRLRRSGWRTVGDPEQIVHLARYFGVSYHAMRMRLMEERRLDVRHLAQDVKPVALARALGYRPSRFEFGERPLPPGERFPRAYLDLARRAIQQKALSPQRVAEMLDVSELELEDLLSPQRVEAPEEACA